MKICNYTAIEFLDTTVTTADPELAMKQERLLDVFATIRDVNTKTARIDDLYQSGEISVEDFGKPYRPLEQSLRKHQQEGASLQAQIRELDCKKPTTPREELDISRLVSG